jgi:hypothetical protein
MQHTLSKPEPTQGRHSYAPLLKVLLVVSLLALVASLVHWIKRPRANAVESTETVPQAEAMVAASPAPVRRLAAERPVATQPRIVSRPNTRAYNAAWGNAVTVHKSNYLVAARLPELQAGIGGLMARLEPLVYYRLPSRHIDEMYNDFAQIASATNALNQHDVEVRLVMATIEKDFQDYVRHAKAADEQRQNQAATLAKKLLDLQALYLERKREFEQESEMLKPRLQDNPAVFNQKLPAYELAVDRYASDMKALETTIYELQQQIYAMHQTLRSTSKNIDTAFAAFSARRNGAAECGEQPLASANRGSQRVHSGVQREAGPIRSSDAGSAKIISQSR